jgi:hypothetical protein
MNIDITLRIRTSCHGRGFESGRNVTKAKVEQVRVDADIGADKDALGGEALGTVTGHGVSAVEVAVVLGVELDLAVAVEKGENEAIRGDGLDGGKAVLSWLGVGHDYKLHERGLVSVSKTVESEPASPDHSEPNIG